MSSTFIINKAKSSPQVIIDCSKGLVEFNGSCMPEDSVEFFRPIYNKIDCLKEVTNKITFTLLIDYINSGSLKAFVDLFIKVKDMKDKDVEIIWKVEEDDEELIDTIEDIHRISQLNFTFQYI